MVCTHNFTTYIFYEFLFNNKMFLVSLEDFLKIGDKKFLVKAPEELDPNPRFKSWSRIQIGII